MAVDLTDLIESLRRELSPPGTDLYPDATDTEWVGHLADSFWEARLHGMFAGYVESEGEVTPSTGSTDLGRDHQQVLVLYAGYRIVLSDLRNVTASFRTKAGPVEFETSRPVQLLKDVLAAIRERIALAVSNLTDVGETSVDYFDAVVERTYSSVMAEAVWIR